MPMNSINVLHIDLMYLYCFTYCILMQNIATHLTFPTMKSNTACRLQLFICNAQNNTKLINQNQFALKRNTSTTNFKLLI